MAEASPSEHARVSFPASPAFARVGRVSSSGFALRLGLDISRVENLRAAVDRAVEALSGEGAIELVARWQDQHLVITITNPRATVVSPAAVQHDLAPLVAHALVEPSRITLELLA